VSVGGTGGETAGAKKRIFQEAGQWR